MNADMKLKLKLKDDVITYWKTNCELMKAEMLIWREGYDEQVRMVKDAKYEIAIIQRQNNGLNFEQETLAHRVVLLTEEIDLLKHILSINKIQLTTEVIDDAQRHLRELTKELVE
tara:strand:- start:1129 stop:1473 length:345 start_codon:yes stop_codon:yes gene_type:complete